tara:strand:- start:1151 stop:2428 length:1278 start_codon:yes stop_codon:yes gene_type:complete
MMMPNTITVNKSLFWESPRIGCRVDAYINGYTSPKDPHLMGIIREVDFDQIEQPVADGGLSRLIRSENGGHSWQARPWVRTSDKTDNGSCQNYLQFILTDQRNDLCLLFTLRRWVKSPQTAARDIKKYSRQLYQISHDGGKTWGKERTMIQTGPEFNQTHYMRNIRFGCNAGFISNTPLQLRDGSLLLPFHIWPWNEREQKADPNQKTSGVVTAHWKDTCSGIDWDMSEYLSITEESGCLSEITLAERNDGSILGIMRASSPDSPGKFYSISHDHGQTWSQVQRLSFDNGDPLYSPSSISHLIRSSCNGKLYWIGNILSQKGANYLNLSSNRHRFILQIAEVDEITCTIRKQTVTTIDESIDPENPKEYSNAWIYEDRDTGYFILTMCQACALPFSHHSVPSSYCGPFMTKEAFTSNSYKYEIAI